MWMTQAVVRVADLPVSLSEFVAATRAELVKVTDVASAAGTAVLASDVDIPGLGPDDRAVRLDYPAGATACLAVVATGQAASVLAFMPAPNEQLLTQAVEAARHRLTEPS
jgi:hypothetical protein